jgi:hypothetical protein
VIMNQLGLLTNKVPFLGSLVKSNPRARDYGR